MNSIGPSEAWQQPSRTKQKAKGLWNSEASWGGAGSMS